MRLFLHVDKIYVTCENALTASKLSIFLSNQSSKNINRNCMNNSEKNDLTRTGRSSRLKEKKAKIFLLLHYWRERELRLKAFKLSSFSLCLVEFFK